MKKNQGFSVVEILLLVAIVGVICAIGLIAWKNYNQPRQSGMGLSQEPPTIVEEVKNRFISLYPSYSGHEVVPDGHIRTTTSTFAPYYKVPGDAYSIAYDGGMTLTADGPYTMTTGDKEEYATSDIDFTLRDAARRILTDRGLRKSSEQGTNPAEKRDVFVKDDVICTVTSRDAATYTTTVGCGLANGYKTESAKIKEYVAQLPEKITNPDGRLEIYDVENSPVAGYQRSKLNVSNDGGYIAYFYKKSEGPWLYFKATQSSIDCSAYTTQDLKNAFQRTPCYDKDTQKESVVR